MVSEAELLARCRRGKADAWDELFERHYAATGRFIFQLGYELTREDAEEICQQTFLAVIQNLRSFHGGSQLQTWVFRIAANKARDYRERLNAAKRGGGIATIPLQPVAEEGSPAVDPASPAPTPDALLMNAEQMALLQQALDEMDEPCREMVQLRYFGDASYEEIGRALRLNHKTVSSRLSRCLDRLGAAARRIFSRANTGMFPSNSV